MDDYSITEAYFGAIAPKQKEETQKEETLDEAITNISSYINHLDFKTNPTLTDSSANEARKVSDLIIKSLKQINKSSEAMETILGDAVYPGFAKAVSNELKSIAKSL